MKIFHFILDHRIGGPHAYVRTLSQWLGPVIESVVVTTGRGSDTDVELFNFRHRMRVLYPLEIICNVGAICWRFRRISSRSNLIFDVHGAANLAPLIASRILGIPVVWHFHETVPSMRVLVRFGARVLSGVRHKIVVVAEASARAFKLKDIEFIPGAVASDFWERAKKDGRARNPGAPVRLVAIGNLNPLKGLDLLLDALSAVRFDWELTVAGAELSTFRKYASELRVKAAAIESIAGSRVKFVGWMSQEGIRDLLSSADVFILPSRSEACPIALLEAMSMGMVCVASQVGDVRQILEDDQMGIVTSPGSVDGLAAALERVVGMGDSERSEMGMRARQRILRDYSPHAMASKHLAVYRDLLAGVEVAS